MKSAILRLDVRWRAAIEPAVRRRVEEELRNVSWALSEAQLAVHDLNRRLDSKHAWLLPRMELRLPVYDVGLRWRILFSELDGSRIYLVDENGDRVADVKMD